MAIQYPVINGNKFDFASIEAELAGGIFKGINELTYTDTLEPGIVRGTGPEKLARTLGEYDSEGSIVMYHQDFQDFLALLTNDGETGSMDTVFNITVSMSAPGGDGTKTDRLIGIRLTSIEGGGSQGTDPLTVTGDLNIMRIERGGILPITNMLV